MIKFETVEDVREWYRERYPGYPITEEMIQKCCEMNGVLYEPPENEQQVEIAAGQSG